MAWITRYDTVGKRREHFPMPRMRSTRMEARSKKGGCPHASPSFVDKYLRYFDQFHLAVAAAMKHEEVSAIVSEDEQIAIAEFGFLHRLFNRHRFQGDSFGTGNDMRLDDRGARRKR